MPELPDVELYLSALRPRIVGRTIEFYVSDLIVSAAHRGRGIGRRLLRAAEALAREAGARTIRLSVKAGNVGARSLYAAEGFEEAEIYLEKPLGRAGNRAT